MSILKLMDNVVTALASTFLIGSSLSFRLTRTLIINWMSFKFCRIRPRTYELAALEHLEKSPWEKRCDHSSAFNFKWICFILADKMDNYESLNEFKFRQDPITYYGVSLP